MVLYQGTTRRESFSGRGTETKGVNYAHVYELAGIRSKACARGEGKGD
jgi:hypothetical protein